MKLIATLCVLLAAAYVVIACNEAVCASLVSKCQLIKSCECDMSDMKNCSCCHTCQLCLSKLYSECCSCVGMCPLPDPEDSIFRTSAIEILPDPIPELFNVLTEEEDHLKRWTVFRYPVFFESIYAKHLNAEKNGHSKSDNIHPIHKDLENLYNCTVAFMSKCTSLHKCKQSCKSMGSTKYRWFHNEGCCQCIGDTCIDYGLNEPKCLECRGDDEEEEEKLVPLSTYEEPMKQADLTVEEVTKTEAGIESPDG